LDPIIWGDMIIGMSDLSPMTKEQAKLIPPGITVDFWNYSIEDSGDYAKMIDTYRRFGFEPVVSPGLWNWNRLWSLYPKVERTMVPLMEAAKRAGIKRALLTMCGDDGQETPWRSNLPGLAL